MNSCQFVGHIFLLRKYKSTYYLPGGLYVREPVDDRITRFREVGVIHQLVVDPPRHGGQRTAYKHFELEDETNLGNL